MLKYNEKHTYIQTIILHLFPGIFIAMINFICIPFVVHHGFPNDVANLIAIVIVLVPLEFGVLLYVTKKKTGTYKVKTQIRYLEKSSLRNYLIFIPLMAIWAIFINELLTPVEIHLRDTFFACIPPEYMIGNYEISQIAREKVVITCFASLLLNGIIAPCMEEVYFRGYLLPRIDLSQNKAILANAVLFSMYHFFSPWHFLSRILMMIPLYYWVMRTKNLRFSLIAHIIANSATSLTMLITL